MALELAATRSASGTARVERLRLGRAELAAHVAPPHADAARRSSRRRASAARAARPGAGRSSRRSGRAPGRSRGTWPGRACAAAPRARRASRKRISSSSGDRGQLDALARVASPSRRAHGVAEQRRAACRRSCARLRRTARGAPGADEVLDVLAADRVERRSPKNGARWTRSADSVVHERRALATEPLEVVEVAAPGLLDGQALARPGAATRPRPISRRSSRLGLAAGQPVARARRALRPDLALDLAAVDRHLPYQVSRPALVGADEQRAGAVGPPTPPGGTILLVHHDLRSWCRGAGRSRAAAPFDLPGAMLRRAAGVSCALSARLRAQDSHGGDPGRRIVLRRAPSARQGPEQ